MSREPTGTENVSFACRIDADAARQWKAYCKAGGYGQVGKMTVEAMREYMTAHPLTGEQEKEYKRLIKLKSM